MSRGRVPDDQKLANVVGINAKSVGVPPLPTSSQIPLAWKRASREILLRYADEPVRRGHGPPRSFGSIRDEVMRPYDIIKTNGRPDRRGSPLGRSLFEHFMNGSTNLNDSAFKFVDRFVRTLFITDDYGSALDDLVRYRASLHKSAITDMYCPRDRTSFETAERLLRSLDGSVFTSLEMRWPFDKKVPLAGRWYKGPAYVSLYVGPTESGAADVSAIYSDVTVDNLDIDQMHRLLIFHGYMVPIRWTDSPEHSLINQVGERGWADFVLLLFYRAITGAKDQVEVSVSLVSFIGDYFSAQGCPFIGNPEKGNQSVKGVQYKYGDNLYLSESTSMSLFQVSPETRKISAIAKNLHDRYLIW